MGLNLSLKGQRIIPKLTQKREIKCERTENKSLHYTLARLASSSRVRRTTSTIQGPTTILDFMMNLNFKSRLDREREMIRRKIRSSTLYRKPSFSKSSGFSIFSTNGLSGSGSVSCITKNIKIGEPKEESLRKIVKSSLFLGEENDDESTNEGILCIGNKYLDVTSSTTTLVKAVSSSSLVNTNDVSDEKQIKTDFEKAISQSHLSTSSKKDLEELPQENFFAHHDDSKVILSSENDEIPSSSLNKRKNHNKIIKKSTNSFVGLNVGKYSDAQKTEVALDFDLTNSTLQSIKTQTTPVVSKAKKSGTKKKSSTHSKKLETKNNSPKMTAKQKSESL
jgi:hypothetical protein